MTVLWETERQGTRYSVRAHGASVRLYSNGVFHSQWNAGRPFAGGVWDCLSLPVLYRPPAATRRVLVLGLGGGAVIRQLERLVPFRELIAVELDPVHVQVARRWFGVVDRDAPVAPVGSDAPVGSAGPVGPPAEEALVLEAGSGAARVTLIEGDAVSWLQRRCDEPFDLVVDDLFGHERGEPLRARALTPDWVALLRTMVSEAGLLVVNCADGRELKVAAGAFADEGFAHAHRWSQPGYANAIGVFSGAALLGREWSRRLEACALPAEQRRQARRTVRRPLRS